MKKKDKDPKIEAAKQISEEFELRTLPGGVTGGMTVDPITGEQIISFHSTKEVKQPTVVEHKISPEELAKHKASEAEWLDYEAEDDYDAYEDGWDASFVPEPENFREGPMGFGLDPQEHLEMLKADDKEGQMYRDAVINSFEQEINSFQTMLDIYEEDDDMDGAKQYFIDGIEGMADEIDYILNIETVMNERRHKNNNKEN